MEAEKEYIGKPREILSSPEVDEDYYEEVSELEDHERDEEGGERNNNDNPQNQNEHFKDDTFVAKKDNVETVANDENRDESYIMCTRLPFIQIISKIHALYNASHFSTAD